MLRDWLVLILLKALAAQVVVAEAVTVAQLAMLLLAQQTLEVVAAAVEVMAALAHLVLEDPV